MLCEYIKESRLGQCWMAGDKREDHEYPGVCWGEAA